MKYLVNNYTDKEHNKNTYFYDRIIPATKKNLKKTTQIPAVYFRTKDALEAKNQAISIKKMIANTINQRHFNNLNIWTFNYINSK